MAGELGPFPRFEENRARDAARHPQPPPRRLRRAPPTEYEELTVLPLRSIDADYCPPDTARAPRSAAWDRALELGERTATATRRRR